MIIDACKEQLIQRAEYELLHYPHLSVADEWKYRIKRILKRRSTTFQNYFNWPNAFLAMALHKAGKNTEDYFDTWIKRGMKFTCIDNVMNGTTLIELDSKNQEAKYRIAIECMHSYVGEYSILPCGSIPYNKKTPQDIYVDAIGTVVPFLCKYGRAYDDKTTMDLGIKQIDNFFKYGMDEETGLPYHGFNAETGTKQGIIGWGRSIGWLLFGIIESITYIDRKEDKERLTRYFKDLVDKLSIYQKENGYFAWQLQAKEGPSDTSATAMIGYAIAKGYNQKILQASDNEIAIRALQALETSIKDGKIINCSGECIGFGQYPQWNYGAYPWALGPGLLLINEEMK